MTRVLLCGAFGQGNAGDEALLEAFVVAMPRHDVLVTSTGPVPSGAMAIAPKAAVVARAARHVDAVVVGGGTVFKTLHPASHRSPGSLLIRTALVLTAAHARGIPVLLVG